MTNPNPIGIFDSGVGGISVMKEIRHLLPAENIIYFADSAYCPYGTKTSEEIRQRITKIARFMIEHNAKVIVAACNTASIAGLDFLRQMFQVPIVGMEPAIKPAAAITKNGKIGVMATGVTIVGERFLSLVNRFAEDIEVIKVPCPGLVERVEQGLNNDCKTEDMVRRFLAPLISGGVDTVVLGCTHYPFLRHTVELIMGPKVEVIDTGNAVARRVVQVLREEKLLGIETGIGSEMFYTSGNVNQVKQVVTNLWGKNSFPIFNPQL